MYSVMRYDGDDWILSLFTPSLEAAQARVAQFATRGIIARVRMAAA